MAHIRVALEEDERIRDKQSESSRQSRRSRIRRNDSSMYVPQDETEQRLLEEI